MTMSKAIVSSKDKMHTLKKLFDSALPSLMKVAPKQVTPERLLKVALTSIQRTPALLACDQMSLLRAVFQAGELGLEAGGLLGEGYLVPYKGQVQFIVGYRGMVKLARQSGDIASIEARAVFEKDAFTIEYGLESKLIHKPYLGKEDPGDVVFVYAIATFKTGEKQCDVMSRAEIDRIRNRSQAANDGPWVNDFAEMAKKTVVRRLCKMLPLSAILRSAVEHEHAIEEGLPSPLTIDVDIFNEETGEVTEPKTRTDALKDELAKKANANGVVAQAATEPAPANEVAS